MQESIEFPGDGNQRGHFHSREHAVAGSRIVEEDNVAGLLAAKIRVYAQHLFQHVTVADGNARKLQAVAFEGSFETQIRHARADDCVAFQALRSLHEASGGEKNRVAIDVPATRRRKNSAVGVAVKRHPQMSAGSDGLLLHFARMKRAAVIVDIAAVGIVEDRPDFRAESAKKLWRERAGRAVGAVENDFHTSEICARKHFAAEGRKIFKV